MKKYIIFILIILIFPFMVYAEESNKEVMTDSNNITNPANVEIISQNCESLLGNPITDGSPAFYLAFIFSVMKYIAIVLLIVISSMDLIGAVASQDNDIIKKAVSKMTIRAIYCVVIFLLPTFIEFTLKMIHNRTITTCGIGI